MASILIVDDEALVRSMTRTALERAGHRVADAAHGAEALALLDLLPIARKAGADYTIGKPFNIPDLLALVSRALAV